MRRAAISLVIWLALGAWVAPGASADQGVRIDLGQIAIDEHLTPGGSYRLPTLTVTNSGDEAGRYEVAVAYLDDGHSRPPASWLKFNPSSFELEPGEPRAVRIEIELPTNATAGDYSALIEARPELTGEGVTVAGAAGSRLYFSVKPASWLDAWTLRIERWMDDNSPWSFLVPLLVIALLALAYARRRIRISVTRR